MAISSNFLLFFSLLLLLLSPAVLNRASGTSPLPRDTLLPPSFSVAERKGPFIAKTNQNPNIPKSTVLHRAVAYSRLAEVSKTL